MMTAAPIAPVSAQVEAEGTETVTLEWEGIPITVPTQPDDWDLELVEALEAGRATTFLRGLLGAPAYDVVKATYRAAHAGAFPASKLGELMDAIVRALGFESSPE